MASNPARPQLQPSAPADSSRGADAVYMQHYTDDQAHAAGQQGGTIRVVTRIIFLEKPTTIGDIIPFAVVFFVYGLIIQILLSTWKKFHKKSHDIFQLFMVLVFPPLIMLSMSDRLFIFIWLVFLCFIIFCLKKVVFRPMTNEVPKEIFNTFKFVILYTNIFIMVGQLATTLAFFLYMKRLLEALRLLLYSLYIAVLAREVVFNLSHVMASKAGYFSKEGIPGVKENNSVCMVCTGTLAGSAQIVSLNCGHSYHNECIRGWCLIGQNRYCPYCKKGIDHTFFTQDLWEKTELPFKPMMNLLRSFISFFIIIYCIIMYKIR